MNSRTTLRFKSALCAVLLLALILTFLLRSRTQDHNLNPQSKPPVSPTMSGSSPNSSAAQLSHEDKVALLNVPVANELQAAMLWSNAFPEKAVRYAAAVRGANAPIHFFGLCLDQDGKPLAGVKIKLGVRQWKGFSPIDLRGEEHKFERISDANGRFELSGTIGDVAGIDEAFKAGYTWIPGGTVSRNFYRPRESLPSLAEPVVLQFWKKLPAQPMFAAAPPLRQKVRCDGTPSLYDLKSGLVAAQRTDATVQFLMERDPQVLNASTTKRPSWSLTVEIPGGAVQLASTNMPFVAPAEGYLGRAVFGFDAADAGWSPRTNTTIYYRTGTGMYGRLEFDITATTDGSVAALNWNSFLNPSGSRVLEHDPAKQLKAPASTPSSAFQGAAPQPPATAPPQPSAPPKASAPFVPQPPPGFQTLTNRAQPVPPRPLR